MKTFTIIPILGKKTDVLPDDPSMLQMVTQTVAVTHDAGGENYSLKRMKNAVTKSLGATQKSNTAVSSAVRCLGLFELYDGTNRNFFNFEHGKVWKYDSSWDPAEVVIAASTTFATDSVDLYSICRVGAYIVWADRAETTPHKWDHGDATHSKLIASGTEYKFRYLGSFQRRIIGLYSDQTDGNIDIRWSTDWPTTAITSLNFPATNQLWVPNDDPITGGASLGRDKFFIFCENSIQQLVYYPDYSTPFRCFTVVPYQGSVNHHSIVEANGQLYFYNEDFGFCSYGGGRVITPISDDIIDQLRTMDPAYYPVIYGKHIPYDRQIIWSVPLNAASECNTLVIYNYDTGQWEVETKTARCIDEWHVFTTQTWATLEAAFGGTGLWSDGGDVRWADFIATGRHVVYANTDGHFYQRTSEANIGAAYEGFREEPVLFFGNKRRYDTIQEIWFDIGEAGSFGINVQHRSGNTTGELVKSGWTDLGSISCNSPREARMFVNLNARLHQIKWGTSGAGEKFVVNGIIFKYITGTEI